MISETEQLARLQIAERIHDTAQHDRLQGRRERGTRPRSRLAAALHRLADRVEPPVRRRHALSVSGR